MLAVFVIILTIILIFPLISLFSKAFQTRTGEFAGLDNYIAYFDNPSLSASIVNTIDISIWSTAFSLTLGFLYAYALTRTCIKGKIFFKYIALTPIFMPTVVHAIGLIFLFGRQGIITRLLEANIELYGRTGIIISEIIFTFPQSFLMFFIALEYADGRLYEAADSMGVSPLKKLSNITLQEIKYTVINAFFVCFTLAFTDFGAPKVLGGNFNVLAIDIYKQVVGQFNMNMGAVVGTLLLIPAFISFIADRVINSKNAGTIGAKATKLEIKQNTGRDVFFFSFCAAVSAGLLLLIGSLFVGAFTEFYPFNMDLTLKNFRFNQTSGGIGAYFNSLKMAGLSTIIGTTFVFIYAYLIEKTSGNVVLRRYGKFLSFLPMALPGMVIGISFIFFFNSPANPLHFIYGTIIILVLANILNYFTVPFLTASACLKKLDKEYESVSDSMSIPRWKTFIRVSVPLSLPAILEVFMYLFVNSMVTISAVVFLYSPRFKIASISITHMEEAGNTSQAAAMSLLILAINVFVRILYEAAIKIIKQNSEKKENVYV
ncbi:MAG: putative 2-aminoethylphosphonate ABC transporter permease subunit [Synergistaceae bacterium]|nr:putative 2-aminoethylphosphonate ABC transporter permease subunit [Synergistaceae bacterium]